MNFKCLFKFKELYKFNYTPWQGTYFQQFLVPRYSYKTQSENKSIKGFLKMIPLIQIRDG